MVRRKQEEEVVGSKLETPHSSKKQLLVQVCNMERLAEIFRVNVAPSALMSSRSGEKSKRSQRPAKWALHAFATITRDVGLQLSYLYKRLVDMSEEEKTHLPAVLEAPYSDEVLKDIFHLIVGTFSGLKDTSGPSFGTRVVILGVFAKYRPCVVMLDLQCDDLVNEMFSTFFAVDRPDTTENVLCESLFPTNFSVKDKVKHWARVFSEFDEVKVKALEKILEHVKRLVDMSKEEKTHLPAVLEAPYSDEVLKLLVSSAAALGGAAVAGDMVATLEEVGDTNEDDVVIDPDHNESDDADDEMDVQGGGNDENDGNENGNVGIDS